MPVDLSGYVASVNLTTDTSDFRYPTEMVVRKVDNGFIVVCGCKTLVFPTWTDLRNAMSLYWKDPAAAEKKYVKTNNGS